MSGLPYVATWVVRRGAAGRIRAEQTQGLQKSLWQLQLKMERVQGVARLWEKAASPLKLSPKLLSQVNPLRSSHSFLYRSPLPPHVFPGGQRPGNMGVTRLINGRAGIRTQRAWLCIAL